MRRLTRFGLPVGLWLLLGTGCGPTKVTTETSPYIGQYEVRTVAVLPFDLLRTPQRLGDDAEALQVPKGAKGSDISLGVPRETHGDDRMATSRVQPQAAELVTRLVWDRLGSREGLRVKPLDEAKRAALEAKVSEGVSSERLDLAVQIGKHLGVDAVVVGKVLVYQERVGSRIGAESAAVGFEVKLLGLDGRTLWAGNYYEKQRPMTEDLVGFVERKGAFVTAAELAAYGADKVLKEFPYGRKD